MPKQEITTASVDFRDTQRFAIMTLLAAGVYLLFCIPPAQASAIADVLCSVINMILLDIGRAISTLAVIVLGISALLGKATWAQGLTVMTGIAIIFGGPTLALAFFTAAISGSTAAGTAVGGVGGGVGTIVSVLACSTSLP